MVWEKIQHREQESGGIEHLSPLLGAKRNSTESKARSQTSSVFRSASKSNAAKSCARAWYTATGW